jgi:hypothetical protein
MKFKGEEDAVELATTQENNQGPVLKQVP